MNNQTVNPSTDQPSIGTKTSDATSVSQKTVQTNIEILGKQYSIRCPESEINALQEAAHFLNQKMSEVQESGKAINLERIAIISALNIAYQFLQMNQEKRSVLDKVNHYLLNLQNKVDNVLNSSVPAEFIYTTE